MKGSLILGRSTAPVAAIVSRWGAIAVLAGCLLAALGPFGSYLNDGFGRRAAYWIGSMLLGLVVYGSAFKAVVALARPGPRGWWPTLVMATLIGSVPQAIATRMAAFRLWPILDRLGPSAPVWFTQTALIGLIAMVGAAVFHRRDEPDSPEMPGVVPEFGPATPSFGPDVFALQMEDHYVRVHRSGGSELILMPLSRAVGRVEAEGLRTHRSWWVARHAVRAVEGDARSMRLHLSNGVVAPVARSALVHLKAAGWLAGNADDGTASRRPDTAAPTT